MNEDRLERILTALDNAIDRAEQAMEKARSKDDPEGIDYVMYFRAYSDKFVNELSKIGREMDADGFDQYTAAKFAKVTINDFLDEIGSKLPDEAIARMNKHVQETHEDSSDKVAFHEVKNDGGDINRE